MNSLSKTTTVVTQTANEGVSAAKPFLSQAFTFLTTTEPVSDMESGVGKQGDQAVSTVGWPHVQLGC